MDFIRAKRKDLGEDPGGGEDPNREGPNSILRKLKESENYFRVKTITKIKITRDKLW